MFKLYDKAWDDFWIRTDTWERNVSNDDEILSAESEKCLDIIKRAGAAVDESEAYILYHEAVREGSVWALHALGWHYWTGSGVEANQCEALQYYCSATRAGSWLAALHYARALHSLQHYQNCEQVLGDGIDRDFAPSYFWLAYLRHCREPSLTCKREVRHLLEHAAQAGHPAARMTLGRWMARGHYKLRDIPKGFSMVFENVTETFD